MEGDKGCVSKVYCVDASQCLPGAGKPLDWSLVIKRLGLLLAKKEGEELLFFVCHFLLVFKSE